MQFDKLIKLCSNSKKSSAGSSIGRFGSFSSSKPSTPAGFDSPKGNSLLH